MDHLIYLVMYLSVSFRLQHTMQNNVNYKHLCREYLRKNKVRFPHKKIKQNDFDKILLFVTSVFYSLTLDFYFLKDVKCKEPKLLGEKRADVLKFSLYVF